MKITILAIGKLKEKYLVEAVAEYVKRLKIYTKIDIVEIPECRTVDEECDKLSAHVPKDSWLCVLDVFGENVTSEQLADKISKLTLKGHSSLTFVIGGAFGINDKIRSTADFCLSLSKMTFTHQMTRLILIEQIYRAFKINRGEKYHW